MTRLKLRNAESRIIAIKMKSAKDYDWMFLYVNKFLLILCVVFVFANCKESIGQMPTPKKISVEREILDPAKFPNDDLDETGKFIKRENVITSITPVGVFYKELRTFA